MFSEKASHALGSLTPRKTEVLKMIAEGLSNPKIAARLVVTEETVKTHVSRILAKLVSARPHPSRRHRPSNPPLRSVGAGHLFGGCGIPSPLVPGGPGGPVSVHGLARAAPVDTGSLWSASTCHKDSVHARTEIGTSNR